MPMIINTSWLLEYLQPECSHEELLDALPRVGLEIERQVPLSRGLDGIRIGFVRSKANLSGAPGRFVCQIEVERDRIIPVVCASEHDVHVGWGVPVAVAGSVLPTGRTIKADHYHGVQSEGMICLDGEMGMIARASGLFHTTDEALLGRPLPSVTEIPESLLELNVLPNRPDFLGLIGIAREVAALLRLELRDPPTTIPDPTDLASPLVVQIEEPGLCSRYMGAVLNQVRVEQSPAWLKARLLLAGMRPINNIVDISNYVMYECGQPLHTFDFQKINGGRIVVRRIAPDESLELLTGKTITAKDWKGLEPPLVIADEKAPVALAGVMGGAASQTTSRTTEVLVEAAHFDPVTVRKAARRIDLGTERQATEASYRFERGTDPNAMLQGAMKRAIRLISEIAGGALRGQPIDRYPEPRKPRAFDLTAERTSSYLGFPVDSSTIRDCLTRLHMECSEEPGPIEVRVPTWRVDANDPVVLIEDVARMIGYEQVPLIPQASKPSMGLRSSSDRVRQASSSRLVALGFYECRNPSLESLESSRWLGAPPDSIRLINEATREMSVLRRSLLSGLFNTVKTNLSRGAELLRFFEVDRVFGTRNDELDERGAMEGEWRIAAIAGGRSHRSDWRGDAKQVDFFWLKGVLEDLLEGLGERGVTYRGCDRPAFVPGASAEILSGAKRPLGVLGEVDPRTAGIERLPFPLFAFEIDLGPLALSTSSLPIHQPTPRFPAVTRDLALVVPDRVDYDELYAVIRDQVGPLLHSMDLVDRYKGAQVTQGCHSMAFRLVFRDPKRTLTTEEVSEKVVQALDVLKERFRVDLRS
ncbi:MAG: phenylalanine--tRNA ligase subunit beta [Isosphaeraceae bacterium]